MSRNQHLRRNQWATRWMNYWPSLNEWTVVRRDRLRTYTWWSFRSTDRVHSLSSTSVQSSFNLCGNSGSLETIDTTDIGGLHERNTNLWYIEADTSTTLRWSRLAIIDAESYRYAIYLRSFRIWPSDKQFIDEYSSTSRQWIGAPIHINGKYGIVLVLLGTSIQQDLICFQKETLLEKILQERLRLVQQMADLNKQHELAQDEIVTFETKANQSRSSWRKNMLIVTSVKFFSFHSAYMCDSFVGEFFS